ncbi:hypothetical protein N665_0001s0150 [Sinapis alba]|nr:hypothetical protein N665_0001s0150 [Sinapis alba]
MGITFSRITNQVITTRSQLDEIINLFLLNKETPQTQSSNPIEQHEHYQLISSFLEVAVGQTVETAKRFLETTNWNIDESINLFLLDKNYDPSMHNKDHVAMQSNNDESSSDDDSTTFDDGESDSALLFEGRTFEEAKTTCCTRNLWLLVNLQSKTEFASHTLNRDVWANDVVSETVMSSFVLWQVYDNTIEGKKISSFYKIYSAPPVVLVVDPVTGQKMRMWSGVIEAQSFVEDLSWFFEAGPHEHIASLIRHRRPETEEEDHTCSTSNQVPVPSWGEEFENVETCSSSNNSDTSSWGAGFEESAEVEEEKNGLGFPDLTEEAKLDCDKSLVCNLCVRFPDGRRKQRRFLKTEPVQLLWSFCYSHMEGYYERNKAFKLVHAIPGACKTLDYGVNATFQESGLANSMISVAWE